MNEPTNQKELFKQPKPEKRVRVEETFFPIIPTEPKSWAIRYPKAWEAYEQWRRGRIHFNLPHPVRTVQTEYGWLRDFFASGNIYFWTCPKIKDDGEISHFCGHYALPPGHAQGGYFTDTKEEADLKSIESAFQLYEESFFKR